MQVKPLYYITLSTALWLSCSTPVAAESFSDKLNFSEGDTVLVSAERAWEVDNGDSEELHFGGNFVLRAPDWFVASDSAIVLGNLENPDKIVLKGTPARISFLKAGTEEVNGTANTIEYYRSTNKLILVGQATLQKNDNMLRSEQIEYDVDADQYSASGEGGINIEVKPKD